MTARRLPSVAALLVGLHASCGEPPSNVASTPSSSSAPAASASASPEAAWAQITRACPTGVFVSQPTQHESDPIYFCLLRFYPDGIVISATVGGRDSGERAPDWLDRGSDKVKRGAYRLEDRKLVFATGFVEHTLDLSSAPFESSSFSQKNQHRAAPFHLCLP